MSESMEGLRRMVEHSRALLAPHAAPRGNDGKTWTSESLNRTAAIVLAAEVLALVAQCIERDPEPAVDDDYEDEYDEPISDAWHGGISPEGPMPL